MPTPTYSQLITLSSTANGLISESIEERILTIMAMLASGQNPDGTATSAQQNSVQLPPHTCSTGLASTSVALPSVSSTLYMRSYGVGTISGITMYVGTSSGNICTGIYSSAGGASPPSALVATTGTIPCPAAGSATVTLGASVYVTTAHYFALTADNVTAKWLSPNNVTAVGVSTGLTWGVGLQYLDNAAPPPLQPTPGTISTARGGLIPLIGQ